MLLSIVAAEAPGRQWQSMPGRMDSHRKAILVNRGLPWDVQPGSMYLGRIVQIIYASASIPSHHRRAKTPEEQ
jgi:hypothetical protein